ncbi:MAG TPA: hypothetical protein VFG66_10395 [Gemmatimonadales bacterium]|nr:hypothetical protein [Gemmatimonadales bacterium]
MKRRNLRSTRHRRPSGERQPYEPRVVYQLAERARSQGVDLKGAVGPWRAGRRQIRRRGRASLHEIAVVTNEHTAVVVDSAERAADVAGLLNWCGVHELDPVPSLTPPGE